MKKPKPGPGGTTTAAGSRLPEDARTSAPVITVALSDDAFNELVERVAARLMATQEPEPWIGVAEAAEHRGCTRQRIYDLVHQGRVRYAKDGTRLKFKRSWLDEDLESSA